MSSLMSEFRNVAHHMGHWEHSQRLPKLMRRALELYGERRADGNQKQPKEYH